MKNNNDLIKIVVISVIVAVLASVVTVKVMNSSPSLSPYWPAGTSIDTILSQMKSTGGYMPVSAVGYLLEEYYSPKGIDFSDCWETQGYHLGSNLGLTVSCDLDGDFVMDGVLVDSYSYCVDDSGYPLFTSVGSRSLASNGLVSSKEFVCTDSSGIIHRTAQASGVCCRQ